jgi:hypothetical protein
MEAKAKYAKAWYTASGQSKSRKTPEAKAILAARKKDERKRKREAAEAERFAGVLGTV